MESGCGGGPGTVRAQWASVVVRTASPSDKERGARSSVAALVQLRLALQMRTMSSSSSSAFTSRDSDSRPMRSLLPDTALPELDIESERQGDEERRWRVQ